MEQLPEEVREIIFDYVLRDNPATLFNLRYISKTWKIIVDEYTSRFDEWYNACKQEMPRRCFTEIVENIAPLSAYSWQDSYWMRFARSSTIPKDVYHAWKNLPSLMRHNYQITELERDPHVDNTDLHKVTVADNYIMKTFRASGIEPRAHIFDIQNLSTPIRSFNAFVEQAHFFTDSNGICRVLLKWENDNNLYMVEFLHAHNELFFSGLCLCKNKNLLVVANECFTFDNNTSLVITHYQFTAGRLQPSKNLTLPSIPPPRVVYSIHISGNELRVLVLIGAGCRPSETKTVKIFRYKIDNSSGKLSFTESNKFPETIYCNLPSGLPNCIAKIVDPIIVKNIVYAKLVSSLYKAVNDGYHRPGIFGHEPENTRWVNSTSSMALILCAACHANYMVLGTSNGSIWIYEDNDDGTTSGIEVNPTSSKRNVINLGAAGIQNIYIRYVGLKLRIIADSDQLYIIDFPAEDGKF